MPNPGNEAFQVQQRHPKCANWIDWMMYSEAATRVAWYNPLWGKVPEQLLVAFTDKHTNQHSEQPRFVPIQPTKIELTSRHEIWSGIPLPLDTSLPWISPNHVILSRMIDRHLKTPRSLDGYDQWLLDTYANSSVKNGEGYCLYAFRPPQDRSEFRVLTLELEFAQVSQPWLEMNVIFSGIYNTDSNSPTEW